MFTEDWIDAYVTGVWLKMYTPQNLSVEYHMKVGAHLEDGLNEGFGYNSESDIVAKVKVPKKKTKLAVTTYESLRENLWIFSAAKQYSQVVEMSKLINESSDFKTFSNKAKKVFETYNKNYLKTEYNTAVGQSQMARDWVNAYEQKDDLPYLRYHTQKDKNVRDEHAVLDGITLPVGDKFWDMWMPKNGFNCRCFTSQQYEAKIKRPSKAALSELKDETKFPELFRMNPGKDGIVFSKKHPYFRVEKGDKNFRDNAYNLPIPR